MSGPASGGQRVGSWLRRRGHRFACSGEYVGVDRHVVFDGGVAKLRTVGLAGRASAIRDALLDVPWPRTA